VRIPSTRLQLAALVPIDETRRATPTLTEFGGGIGDINLSARYDFFLAGQSEYVPGIALLAGVTFPTGTPPESASKPLATDATGVGAYQGNIGLALEQTYGSWLVGLSGILAKRTTRNVNGVSETLGTQFTALAVGGYTFESSGIALALIGSYQTEGEASAAGVDVPGSGRHILTISAAGLVPIGDKWRLQAALFTNPPFLGENLPALTGLSFTVVRTW
jgi:hypothetical protein